jgi:hypothetical protein
MRIRIRKPAGNKHKIFFSCILYCSLLFVREDKSARSKSAEILRSLLPLLVKHHTEDLDTVLTAFINSHLPYKWDRSVMPGPILRNLLPLVVKHHTEDLDTVLTAFISSHLLYKWDRSVMPGPLLRNLLPLVVKHHTEDLDTVLTAFINSHLPYKWDRSVRPGPRYNKALILFLWYGVAVAFFAK